MYNEKEQRALAATNTLKKNVSKIRKTRSYCNSANSQCKRLVKYFTENQPNITVGEARDILGILHAPARVKELRRAGYDICTTWISELDRNGVNHSVGLYSYHGKREEGTVHE